MRRRWRAIATRCGSTTTTRRSTRRIWSNWASSTQPYLRYHDSGTSMLRDLAFAIRTLRKNAAFSLTAIVTLALGIGATTAIFSVVNAVLLRPLPYDHPERLTIIWGELRQ